MDLKNKMTDSNRQILKLKERKMIYLFSLIVLVFCCAFIGSKQKPIQDDSYSDDKKVIERGEVLFQQNCAACHNFIQRGIGPSLAGITSKVSAIWLTKFITNSQEMVEEGDLRAKELFDEYQIPMPSFSHFNKEEIQAILSFLHTKKESVNPQDDMVDLGPVITNPIPEKIQKSGLTLA